MEAPLNIMYVDPEIKANPIYCNIDESASERAGIANTHFLWGTFPGSSYNLALSPNER